MPGRKTRPRPYNRSGIRGLIGRLEDAPDDLRVALARGELDELAEGMAKLEKEKAELEKLRGLATEQLPNFLEAAQKDRSKPTVSWIAEGEHLVLVIVDQAGTRVRRFDCRILHMTELPRPEKSPHF